MSTKRVFVIVLDSFGIGLAPDAAEFGDEGSDTLAAIAKSDKFDTPNLKKLGLFNIEGVACKEKEANPIGSFARMRERSRGKDTTIGHWEIAGIVSPEPLPTFPQGFPKEVLDEFEAATGRGVLCNHPYSGTEVIADYGREHEATGKLIVYTSADSVFQIAAHESLVPVEELYSICKKARKILAGPYAVGRVIARPFTGSYPNYTRTSNRHDFSLVPPRDTMLTKLVQHGFDTIGVGKIYDIFAGKDVQKTTRTKNNDDGMAVTMNIADEKFNGLCFVNLVDFDMVYGHRNNVEGYANAMTQFDRWLGGFLTKLGEGDVLIITADHGCDPSTPSTDHSRECTPMLICGGGIKRGADLGVRAAFADIGATVLDLFDIAGGIEGESFKNYVLS